MSAALPPAVMPARRAQRGLTLIELLVAVLLLAVIASMAYRGLDSMTRSSERVELEVERWQNLALFFERLARDVVQPARRPVRVTAADGSAGNPVAFTELAAWRGQPPTDSEAFLEFTRKSPDGRDEVRIGYRLRAAQLELLIWPLLDNVEQLRLRHLDAGGAWQDAWPVSSDLTALPRGIEIELTLRDGLHLRRVFALPS
jgi:general secretion pathway protein J